MSKSDKTHTPTKDEIEDKKQTVKMETKIPKTAASTARPHYINEEEKKLFKWLQTLQYATIGGIYHNTDRDKYIASFNQLDSMTLTFGSSPILDNTNHIVIGLHMTNARINQVVFSITKHNTKGTTTLFTDITPNGERQFIVHQPKGKSELNFNPENPTKIKLDDGDQLQSLKEEQSLP